VSTGCQISNYEDMKEVKEAYLASEATKNIFLRWYQEIGGLM
jgi:hypothetical protein